MPTIDHSAVSIIDNDDQVTTGDMQTTHFNHGDCIKRGLLKLGLFWLLAVGSLPIIFAHWVLVPGFFLAGPWMAFRTYKITHRRDHINGKCPACKKALLIKLEAKDVLPKWTYCPECTAPLQVKQADGTTS